MAESSTSTPPPIYFQSRTTAKLGAAIACVGNDGFMSSCGGLASLLAALGKMEKSSLNLALALQAYLRLDGSDSEDPRVRQLVQQYGGTTAAQDHLLGLIEYAVPPGGATAAGSSPLLSTAAVLSGCLRRVMAATTAHAWPSTMGPPMLPRLAAVVNALLPLAFSSSSVGDACTNLLTCMRLTICSRVDATDAADVSAAVLRSSSEQLPNTQHAALRAAACLVLATSAAAIATHREEDGPSSALPADRAVNGACVCDKPTAR